MPSRESIIPAFGFVAIIAVACGGLLLQDHPPAVSLASTSTSGINSMAGLDFHAPDIAVLIGGIGGGVVGAIVGGAIAWILAHQAAVESRRRDEEERQQAMKSRALRLMVKASLILTDVVGTMQTIDDSLSAANERGLALGPMWQRVMPIVGQQKAFDVDADELAPLIQAKEYALFQEAVDLVMQHQAFVQAVAEYSLKRQALKDHMPAPVAVSGGLVTSPMTAEDMARLAPRTLELARLIHEVAWREVADVA
jgi:hypothetical protein